MEEFLAHSLISLTKKYLSAFSKESSHLDIERYHYVLVLIENHQENLTQKALGEILQVDKSYIVNIIDYLSSKKFVFREKNPKDRREQLIRLTESAKKILPGIRSAIESTDQRSFNSLSVDEIHEFKRMLNVIQNNLSDSQPNEIFLEYKKL